MRRLSRVTPQNYSVILKRLEAVVHNEGITSPLGEWNRDALTDPEIVNGPVTLIVDANQLMLQTDSDGLQITHIDSIGGLNRVTVDRDPKGQLLDFECPRDLAADIVVGSFVRVTPKAGSVFAAPTLSD